MILLTGTVTEEGKIDLYIPREDRDALKQYAGKRMTLTVEPQKRKRSTIQNAYYWAGIVTPMSAHTGYTKRQCHNILKTEFLSEDLAIADERTGEVKREVKISRSTTDLSVGQMMEYIDQCTMFLSEIGCHVPAVSMDVREEMTNEEEESPAPQESAKRPKARSAKAVHA